MKGLPLDFPCKVCGTPARPDRMNGRCETCLRTTCDSCARRCDRCGRTYCQNHVEHRTVMVQQVANQMLLCDLCRRVMLLS